MLSFIWGTFSFQWEMLLQAEAQAAGLDCFVSDAVSRMSDCGKCKFISLTKTASEWADEIVAYIQGNDKMTISEELLAQFDISQMARKLEEIYGL